MKYLVTGGLGFIGSAVVRFLAKNTKNDIYVIDKWGYASDPRNLSETPNVKFCRVDLTNAQLTAKIVADVNPDYIMHLAAESHVDNSIASPSVFINSNIVGTFNLLEAVRLMGDKSNLKMFHHISTDYVFDGHVAGTEESKTNPLNTYGYSKQLGETLVQAVCPTALIIRTASVYSEFGHNFLKTMLERYNGGQKEFNVVCDHLSCPTYAPDLAETIFKLVKDGVNSKIVHYAGADYISWYDFARKIFLVIDLSVTVNPVSASTYNSKAVRPATSYLKTDPTLNPRSVDSGIVRTLTILLNKE